jgi:hypothetical protein
MTIKILLGTMTYVPPTYTVHEKEGHRWYGKKYVEYYIETDYMKLGPCSLDTLLFCVRRLVADKQLIIGPKHVLDKL